MIMQCAGSRAVDLCCVSRHSFLHPSEHIMLSRQHPLLSFAHFVATDYSLLMMDERYLGYPVSLARCQLYITLHSSARQYMLYK